MGSETVLPAARLRELAVGVQQLLPDRRDPHLFHEKRDRRRSLAPWPVRSRPGLRYSTRSPISDATL